MIKAQILVVEDETIVALDIRNRLRSLGYAVPAIASSGEEAIRKAAEMRPDLVLMDIRLKGEMDGVEAAEQIRAQFEIPVVYLTAYADEATLQRAKITEPFGYVLKPFAERELSATVEMALYRHRIGRRLRESERWLSTTLRSIGDAVIATDDKGCIEFINPVAEALTGWKQEEALGRDLIEIFHIIDEQTRTVIENPVIEALREGIVVGLRNHAVLIAKDGTEVSIDDSAAPIRDDKGNITGVVLVFRDITKRRRAEQLLQSLNRAALAMEKALTLGEIFTAVSEELEKLGLSCMVSLTDESQSKLFPKYLSYETKVLKAAEKLVGLKLEDFSIPIEAVDLCGKVLWETETVLVDNAEDVVRQVLPEPVKRFAGQIAQMLGIRKSIVAPLIVGDEVIGMFSVRSDDLAEEDMPAVTAFAHQMAAAWRKAQLFEQAQQEIAERKQTEERIRESEEKFKNIFESVTDCLIYLDKSGRILEVNEKAVQVFGGSKGELLGKHFTKVGLVSLKDIPTLVSGFAGTVAGGAPYVHVSIKNKKGQEISLECSTALVKTDNRIVGVIVIARDVTECKRAEEALEESAERYRKLFEEAQDGIILADAETGVIVDCNRAAAELVGRDKSELIGRHQKILHPPRKIKEGFSVSFKKHIEESEGQVLEEQVITRTGEIKEVAVKANLIRVGDRNLLQGMFRDITGRKRVEKERERLLAQIREQAQQVQQIVDTVPEGVLLLDADLHVLLTNPAAQEYLAVLADVGVGDTLRQGSEQVLTHLGGRPIAELLTSPPQGLWHEVTTSGPVSKRSGDRPERSFEVIARSIETGPETKGWVLVIRDVTQEREIKQRAQQQERLAAVGQLAAGVAHDFNNIMAAIVLYAQMSARSEGLPPRVRERMATINRQAQHATNLIQQILDFGRRAVLERRPLDLAPLLKEQVKLLERTLPESIEIEMAYGWDEYMVNADPTRMQQIITNLALNARDAMPEGGNLRIGLERIRIEERKAAPLPEIETGEWVEVTVSDTGTGIPPDDLAHIFEPFFTTKEPGKGSGLGLPQVYGIVKQHGGEIDVESQVDHGTTFTIYLPALSSRPLKPPTQEMPALVEGQGETILVVEDSASMRKALVECLKLLNYRVLEAANGQEALAILERQSDEASRDADQVALVLSDVVMPRMGGIALLRALKERGLGVGVVMLTGHPLKKGLENLRAQGMMGWLLKPPSLEQLAEMVAQALREGQRSTGAGRGG